MNYEPTISIQAAPRYMEQLQLVYGADAINTVEKDHGSLRAERGRPRLVDGTSCRVSRSSRLPPLKLKIPSLEVIVAINVSVLHDDE